MNNEETMAELTKYKELVIATLNYCLNSKEFCIKTIDFDSDEYYKSLKIKTNEYYTKGKLTKLKQWFHYLTEVFVESTDFAFCAYLKEATGHDVDILNSFHKRVDAIIEKGVITTDRQFYDLSTMVNHISQRMPLNKAKVELLNRLLNSYEQKKRGSAVK